MPNRVTDIVLVIVFLIIIILLFSYLYYHNLKKYKIINKIGLGISILESITVLFLGGFIGNSLFDLFVILFHSGNIIYFYGIIKIFINILVLYGLLFGVLCFIHKVDNELAGKVALNTIKTYIILSLIIGFFLMIYNYKYIQALK